MMEMEDGIATGNAPNRPCQARGAHTRRVHARRAHGVPSGLFLLLFFLVPMLYLTFSELFIISGKMYQQEDQQRSLLLLLDAPMDLLVASFGSAQQHSNAILKNSRPETTSTSTIREFTLNNQQKVVTDTSFFLTAEEREAMNMVAPSDDDDDEDDQQNVSLVQKESDVNHLMDPFHFEKCSSNRIVFLSDHGTVSDPPPGPHERPSNHRDYTIIVDPLPPDRDSEDLTRIYSLPDKDSGDLGIERRTWPVDELDPENCQPMYKWQSKSFPSCNSIHEMDMEQSATEKSLSILSDRGYWRYVWKKIEYNVQGANTTTVWKTLKIQHDMQEVFFENSRIDALAMERLTSSPYVIDIYGYCGLTVVQEYADRDLGQIATMRVSPIDRLELAIKVAQAVADVHDVGADDDDDDDDIMDGAHGPSIVHNDLNLANIMITPDNRPVLNDFNVAIFLKKHKKTGETCPYFSKFPNAQWRAPEEQILHTPAGVKIEEKTQYPIVTSKTDVYALGNLLFRIAHVRSPWKRPGTPRLEPDEKEVIARGKRFKGEKPNVSPIEMQNVTGNPYMKTIVQAIDMCYRYRPEDRPTAKEIVKFLKDAMEKHKNASSTDYTTDDALWWIIVGVNIIASGIVIGGIMIIIKSKSSRRRGRSRTYT